MAAKPQETGLSRSTLLNRFENLIECQIVLPPLAVASIVARPRAIQTQEPGEAIGVLFPLQQSKGMPFKLLVRQLVDGDHSDWPLMRPAVQSAKSSR